MIRKLMIDSDQEVERKSYSPTAMDERDPQTDLQTMAGAPSDSSCGRDRGSSCRSSTSCSPARLAVASRCALRHKSANGERF